MARDLSAAEIRSFSKSPSMVSRISNTVVSAGSPGTLSARSTAPSSSKPIVVVARPSNVARRMRLSSCESSSTFSSPGDRLVSFSSNVASSLAVGSPVSAPNAFARWTMRSAFSFQAASLCVVPGAGATGPGCTNAGAPPLMRSSRSPGESGKATLSSSISGPASLLELATSISRRSVRGSAGSTARCGVDVGLAGVTIRPSTVAR